MANRYVQRSFSSSSSHSPSLGGGAYQGVAMYPAVYGGMGGFGTKAILGTYAPSVGSSFQITSSDNLLLTGNEKATMQNLNDRLASYIEKVRSLEDANGKLTIKIKEHYDKSSPTTDRNFSKYYQAIQDLQAQIENAENENGRLVLQLDNARLAADDFRMKFESELSLKQSVEGDINGLRRFLDDLTMKKTDLELQIEALREDLAYLKKNHGMEVEELSKQLGGSVSVEVDAAPAVNLAKMMSEMRAQYDILVEKNQKEVKDRFDKETAYLLSTTTVHSEEMNTHKSELTEVRRKVQGFEIELQSQLSMKAALESTLADTNARYGAQVAQIQDQIRNLEAQLGKIRSDMGQQKSDYGMLLNIKLRLEMEIAEYRRLLEGETDPDLENLTMEEIAIREQEKRRKTKIIVEELVDGKVVSSKVNEVVEKM